MLLDIYVKDDDAREPRPVKGVVAGVDPWNKSANSSRVAERYAAGIRRIEPIPSISRSADRAKAFRCTKLLTFIYVTCFHVFFFIAARIVFLLIPRLLAKRRIISFSPAQ